MTSSAAAVVDLTDTDLFVQQLHHEAFAVLREQSPVYWNAAPDGTEFWALTKYDDVLAAYRDHATFSSERGAVLGGSFRSEKDTAAGRMLVVSDPPRHRMLRQAMHAAFAPTMAARVSERIQALVGQAIDRLLADGGGDFAVDIATELPAGALMAMMEIGHAEAHQLVRLTRQMIGFRDPLYDGDIDSERLRLAFFQSEIFEFFSELVRERRKRPGDDVVSMLLATEINGRRLPDADVLYNCMNVAVGGNETTSYTSCSGMLALMEHPAQYDLLLSAPAMREPAIEEFLRWGSTNAYVQRVATRDIEIRGTLIRKGDSVTLWSVSANRDGDQFPNADRFDIARNPNRHVSFGSGIHRCVGASIASVELAVLFDALVERQVRLEQGGPVEHLRSNFIMGMNRLPVRVS